MSFGSASTEIFVHPLFMEYRFQMSLAEIWRYGHIDKPVIGVLIG
ncbi:hypothetical protein SAMN05216275_10655 [Streptosporangium canum]|uniref:Uncharacterized protein n=1 Tax=Streptosporangium canum TaxID=324952 RepID=A0A1I3MZI1_9ACTN|nr:hypothetical protein SAMN05216275_10655 [Streptosporangium canum]